MKILLLTTLSLLMTSCIAPRSASYNTHPNYPQPAYNPYAVFQPSPPIQQSQGYHIDKPGYGSYNSGYDITPK